MKKLFLLTLSITIITCSLVGCNRSNGNISKQDDESGIIKQEDKSEYDKIYNIALDSFMRLDEGLNGEMKYIAINSKTLKNATNQDILEILDYFKKYDVKVFDESFDSLKEKGMVKQGNSLEGVLLEIISIEEISENKIKIEGSKFRSGLGAISVESIIVKSENEWKLESADITMIS
jgi:hypothetical protein